MFQRWMPILKKHQVEMPLDCPFHESRDIFRPQQKAKHQHRPSQWTCGLCGKSFYAEKHLDAHFDNRHKSNVNTVNIVYSAERLCDSLDVRGAKSEVSFLFYRFAGNWRRIVGESIVLVITVETVSSGHTPS